MSGFDSSSGKYQTNINKGNISDTISPRTKNLRAIRQEKDNNFREVERLSEQLTSENIKKIGNFLISESDPLRKRKIFDLMLMGLTNENALDIREQVIKLNQEGTEFRLSLYMGINGGSRSRYTWSCL